MNVDLNVKVKTLKLTDKNKGKGFCNFGVGKDFLNSMLKS